MKNIQTDIHDSVLKLWRPGTTTLNNYYENRNRVAAVDKIWYEISSIYNLVNLLMSTMTISIGRYYG